MINSLGRPAFTFACLLVPLLTMSQEVCAQNVTCSLPNETFSVQEQRNVLFSITNLDNSPNSVIWRVRQSGIVFQLAPDQGTINLAPLEHVDISVSVHCLQQGVIPMMGEVLDPATGRFLCCSGADFRCGNNPGPDSSLRFGESSQGSWGLEPVISVWSPSGYRVPIGTGFAAIILDNVTASRSITQPVLLLGVPASNFRGLPLPIDLTPYGAPGFELLVDPMFYIPAFPSAVGPHHAEVSFSVPNDNMLVGEYVHAQWLIHDPTLNPLGLAFTRALEIYFTL